MTVMTVCQDDDFNIHLAAADGGLSAPETRICFWAALWEQLCRGPGLASQDKTWSTACVTHAATLAKGTGAGVTAATPDGDGLADGPDA